VKKKIVENPPRNSVGSFWRRPRLKLGCEAKERRRRLVQLHEGLT
jgi:hypothetical protein